ncbi:MAG TPA: HAD-IB family hydrolase [Thermomicrobiales bacterium]|nr:HAD-IB family hydrolase [Thermomicrobiales bacterium]
MGAAAAPTGPLPERGCIAAIFDVDRTLLPGTTTERLFLRYLVMRRHYGPRAALATIRLLARHARLGPFHALRQHRPYLRGWEVARMDALGADAFAATIAPRLAPLGVARVGEHLAAGHLTALLSGSLPFLLAPLARRLGVAHVIVAPLEVVDGAYTGELAGEHAYAATKARLADRFAREHGADLADAYAYADHHTDAALLALCGHPVCVNPTAKLRRLAARRGWPVEAWPAG